MKSVFFTHLQEIICGSIIITIENSLTPFFRWGITFAFLQKKDVAGYVSINTNMFLLTPFQLCHGEKWS